MSGCKVGIKEQQERVDKKSNGFEIFINENCAKSVTTFEKI